MKRMIGLSLSLSLLAVVGCKKKEEKAATPPPTPGTAPATAPGTAPATAPGTAPGTAAPATGDYKLVKAADLKWVPLMPGQPGPDIAVVHGDPMTDAPSALFLRIPPKGDAGLHSHTAGYRATVVSGSPKHWLPGDKDVKALTPGSWWVQPGGQAHGDSCDGPDPCVLFIVLDGKHDFTPTPDAKPGDKTGYKLVKAEDMKFGYPDPAQTTGPKFAFADGDPKVGPVAFQLEVLPTDAVPVHSHTAPYHAVVLAGAPSHWVDGGPGKDEGLAVGDYWYQPGTQMHGDNCTGTAPCKLGIWITGPMDFIPKP